VWSQYARGASGGILKGTKCSCGGIRKPSHGTRIEQAPGGDKAAIDDTGLHGAKARDELLCIVGRPRAVKRRVIDRALTNLEPLRLTKQQIDAAMKQMEVDITRQLEKDKAKAEAKATSEQAVQNLPPSELTGASGGGCRLS
jgi:hypothetical protein